MRSRARRVLVVVLLALGATGCNVDWNRVLEAFSPSRSKPQRTRTTRIPRMTDEEEPKRAPAEPPKPGTGGDLGAAGFPAGTFDPKAIHQWESVASSLRRFSMTYALSQKAAAQFNDKFKAYASSVHYVSGEAHKFKWIPPPGCERDMGCVFQELSDQDRDAIRPVADLFKKKQVELGLDALQIAQLVVNFAQDISYLEPDNEPFGMLAPALVLIRSNGDCDSKSLLAHMILRELGIDSIMLSSVAHRHAMLGIALPVKGTKMVLEGREYAFTELTAKGAVIGYLAPNLSKPNDWKPVLLRRPKTAPPPKPRW